MTRLKFIDNQTYKIKDFADELPPWKSGNPEIRRKGNKYSISFNEEIEIEVSLSEDSSSIEEVSAYASVLYGSENVQDYWQDDIEDAAEEAGLETGEMGELSLEPLEDEKVA